MKSFLLILLFSSCEPPIKTNPAIYKIDVFDSVNCRYYYKAEKKDGVIITYYTVEDSCGKYEIGDTVR